MSNKVTHKKVVKHAHTYTEGADKLIASMQSFGENWGKKLADMEGKVQNFAVGLAKQIGTMFANVQSLAQASMAHDTGILSLDKVNLEIFGQLAQIDTILKHLATKEQMEEWVKPDEIREKAAAWYLHCTKMAFQQVQAEREEQKKQYEEKVKQEREAAEAAEQAKKTDDVVTDAVRQAETPQVVTHEGGPGSDIPEGAQVFGG